jgi:hypothetical protein
LQACVRGKSSIFRGRTSTQYMETVKGILGFIFALTDGTVKQCSESLALFIILFLSVFTIFLKWAYLHELVFKAFKYKSHLEFKKTLGQNYPWIVPLVF